MKLTIALLTTLSFAILLSGCAAKDPCAVSAANHYTKQQYADALRFCSALFSDDKYIKKMQEEGAEYLIEGNKVYIALPSDKLFEPTTADFIDGYQNLLDPLTDFLRDYPDYMITVYGNTDPIAGELANQKLSATQAMRVTGYLWTQCIAFGGKRRIKFIGNGELKPIATNKKLAGMDKNRNIMVVIEPKPAAEPAPKIIKRRKPIYRKVYAK